MARKAAVAEVILEAVAVAQGSGCSYEELVGLCQDLTWNQIFLEVDRLSREGRVRLSQAGPATYRVSVAKCSPVPKAGSGENTEGRSGQAEWGLPTAPRGVAIRHSPTMSSCPDSETPLDIRRR